MARSVETKGRWPQWAIDAVVISILALAGFAFAVSNDALERLVNFVEQHEAWELDEVILVVLATGLGGFVFALRRLRELRTEIGERIAAEEKIARLAFTDALTGLPNRRAFESRVAEMIGGSAPQSDIFAVFALDLDHFKNVNDIHGHGAGDELLVAVANRLTPLLREGDFAARIGGDEFVVVAISVQDSEEATRLARRLLADTAKPIEIGDARLETGMSIGVAMYPADATDPDMLVRRADLALYRAKQEGRGEIRFFETAMDVLVRERVYLETALRHAVRDNEIDVKFQPIVAMEGRKILGFEALARWTDPKLGEVPPQKFIQAAEDSAVISQLSELLLRKACREAAKWPAHLTLSFNISPIQLKDRGLGLKVMQVLAEERLPPARLVLEVTESAIAKDFETAKRVLQELREAGVRIALDDFGTGYANLAQLTHFPFDKIKIDRSFVEQALTNEEQATLVRAMLSIGNGLGLETTAEGIETSEQLAFLQDLGCTIGQGFLFGKAVSGSEALELVDADAPEKRTA